MVQRIGNECKCVYNMFTHWIGIGCEHAKISMVTGRGRWVDINILKSSHEPVLKRCGVINTLTICGREWGGGVLPTFTGAWQWWTVNKDYLQSIKIQVFYYQVHVCTQDPPLVENAPIQSWIVWLLEEALEGLFRPLCRRAFLVLVHSMFLCFFFIPEKSASEKSAPDFCFVQGDPPCR